MAALGPFARLSAAAAGGAAPRWTTAAFGLTNGSVAAATTPALRVAARGGSRYWLAARIAGSDSAVAHVRQLSILSKYGKIPQFTGAEQQSKKPTPAATAPGEAVAALADTTSSSSNSTEKAVVEAAAAAGTANSVAVKEEPKDPMEKVIRDLLEATRIRDDTLELLGNGAEFQAYQDEVEDALAAVRMQYESTAPGSPQMDAPRRAQMQAALDVAYHRVMEKHAEKVADQFVSSLSSAGKQQLKGMFLKLEQQGASIKAEKSRPRSESLGDITKAFQQMQDELAKMQIDDKTLSQLRQMKDMVPPNKMKKAAEILERLERDRKSGK